MTTTTVRVHVAPSPTGVYVTFSDPRGKEPPYLLRLKDAGRIARARQQLDRHLTELKDQASTLDIDNNGLQELATTLGKAGRLLTFLLFGNQEDVIHNLARFWNSVVPAWGNENHTTVVECIGDPDNLLPIEFLPLFNPSGCDKAITGRSDFVRKCRSFIGFSYVVKRTFLDRPVRGRSELEPGEDGRILLRYLHDESLPGAGREYQWLTSTGGTRVCIDGPYPVGGETSADLAEQIYDPTRRRDGRHTAPDHIQHFSCHCYASTKAEPTDYELALLGNEHSLRITLGELGEKLVDYGAGSRSCSSAMPLVVLNACGSSKIDPVSSVSFPDLFLENNNRGFVGTEIAVPDDVAEIFSTAFYRELLLKGRPLGEAVHQARNVLLREHGNPLGLAYVVYGNTDLRVVQQKASM